MKDKELRNADCGLLELMKPDSPPGRFWLGGRIQDLHDLAQDLHDCRLMHVQSRGELFLKRSEFFRKLTRAEQRFAHLDEGAYDKHAHLDGTRATKHICSL